MPFALNSNETHSQDRVEYIRGGNSAALTRCLKPMVNSGALDRYTSHDLTPVIGREFEGLQVRDLINAEEQVIKDLAVTSKYKYS